MDTKTFKEGKITAIGYKHLEVTSKAFNDSGFIPSRYTFDGVNINPPLDINGLPGRTKSMAIIVDDPDAPVISWVHWLAWNIRATRHIEEGRKMEAEGVNDFGDYKYSGPCPPYGIHHYHFKAYALDALLDLPVDITKTELEEAMNGHVIGFGEMTGEYKRA